MIKIYTVAIESKSNKLHITIYRFGVVLINKDVNTIGEAREVIGNACMGDYDNGHR